jgi:hypothetical protein
MIINFKLMYTKSNFVYMKLERVHEIGFYVHEIKTCPQKQKIWTGYFYNYHCFRFIINHKNRKRQYRLPYKKLKNNDHKI